MRKALTQFYPSVDDVTLADYRVRILQPQNATAAITRVLIESHARNKKNVTWGTIGVSGNIIDASYNALRDSYIYYLLKNNAEPSGS